MEGIVQGSGAAPTRSGTAPGQASGSGSGTMVSDTKYSQTLASASAASPATKPAVVIPSGNALGVNTNAIKSSPSSNTPRPANTIHPDINQKQSLPPQSTSARPPQPQAPTAVVSKSTLPPRVPSSPKSPTVSSASSSSPSSVGVAQNTKGILVQSPAQHLPDAMRDTRPTANTDQDSKPPKRQISYSPDATNMPPSPVPANRPNLASITVKSGSTAQLPPSAPPLITTQQWRSASASATPSNLRIFNESPSPTSQRVPPEPTYQMIASGPSPVQAKDKEPAAMTSPRPPLAAEPQPLPQQSPQVQSAPLPVSHPTSDADQRHLAATGSFPSSSPSPQAETPTSAAASNQSSQLPCMRVGDYYLFETIGEGGFSKVKRGQHIKTGEEVAVKIMDKEELLKHELMENIEREVSIMKALRHKNVVQLLHVLASPSKLYLIMELVTGGELFYQIEHYGKLPEIMARKYFQQIVDALDYCHKRGITHRDLKPENVLLDQELNVKLTDFGFSAMKPAGDSVLLRTQCGTPDYCAPEMFDPPPEGYSGVKLDVWAAGVILYAMLTGFLPFAVEEEAPMEALGKLILECKIYYPPELTRGSKHILRRILVRDPHVRYGMKQIRNHPWFREGYSQDEFIRLHKNRAMKNVHLAVFADDTESVGTFSAMQSRTSFSSATSRSQSMASESQIPKMSSSASRMRVQQGVSQASDAFSTKTVTSEAVSADESDMDVYARYDSQAPPDDEPDTFVEPFERDSSVLLKTDRHSSEQVNTALPPLPPGAKSQEGQAAVKTHGSKGTGSAEDEDEREEQERIRQRQRFISALKEKDEIRRNRHLSPDFVDGKPVNNISNQLSRIDVFSPVTEGASEVAKKPRDFNEAKGQLSVDSNGDVQETKSVQEIQKLLGKDEFIIAETPTLKSETPSRLSARSYYLSMSKRHLAFKASVSGDLSDVGESIQSGHIAPDAMPSSPTRRFGQLSSVDVMRVLNLHPSCLLLAITCTRYVALANPGRTPAESEVRAALDLAASGCSRMNLSESQIRSLASLSCYFLSDPTEPGHGYMPSTANTEKSRKKSEDSILAWQEYEKLRALIDSFSMQTAERTGEPENRDPVPVRVSVVIGEERKKAASKSPGSPVRSPRFAPDPVLATLSVDKQSSPTHSMANTFSAAEIVSDVPPVRSTKVADIPANSPPSSPKASVFPSTFSNVIRDVETDSSGSSSTILDNVDYGRRRSLEMPHESDGREPSKRGSRKHDMKKTQTTSKPGALDPSSSPRSPAALKQFVDIFRNRHLLLGEVYTRFESSVPPDGMVQIIGRILTRAGATVLIRRDTRRKMKAIVPKIPESSLVLQYPLHLTIDVELSNVNQRLSIACFRQNKNDHNRTDPGVLVDFFNFVRKEFIIEYQNLSSHEKEAMQEQHSEDPSE